ncbi:Rab-3A-interacting protein [Tupaia chinensis]|uniref:Rab-3A-interacting protein n=1 Tax=Tupaia chinensis TaxID=246437 RepID=L9L3I1_TUPCH|nr:Rab-3A-interacting protein [Tupaia chinensis]
MVRGSRRGPGILSCPSLGRRVDTGRTVRDIVTTSASQSWLLGPTAGERQPDGSGSDAAACTPQLVKCCQLFRDSQTISVMAKGFSYDEAFAMANDPLEGFHEVNLASPTSPDLLSVYEAGTQEQTTSPSVIYRPHPSALCSAHIQANALDVSDLPTQPVYSSPRHLNCAEISGISIHVTDSAPSSTSGVTAGLTKLTTKKDNCNAEREFLQVLLLTEACDGSDDIFGLSTDSLSRLRSPSVLEVREKGYERLKEELAKAQRSLFACDGSDDIFGLSTDSLSRLRSPSVLEVREKGYERLKEELAKAQRELKLKDEECERLSKVRDQLGQELEELTASLFEEAHKMVREANVKQATAEKQLKEAQGKIDVLQAEVAALKTLVLSSSPTSPTQEPLPGGKTPFKKGHTRNKSTSSAMSGSHQDLSVIQPIVKDCKELASAVLEAVENNTLSIEPVGLQPIRFVKASAVECGGPKKCALTGQSKSCKHRIKLGDSSNYYYISPFCRYRITSVCNFFTYIRYIQQGLVKQQDACWSKGHTPALERQLNAGA